MKTAAAILVDTGKPLELVELDIPALKPGQVLIEIKYSGVCYTQVMETRGHKGKDPYVPHCLGHEGSGVVREISPGVTRVKPGDQVILSWIKGAGCDVPGSVYTWNGKPVNAGGITTFSNLSIISENRLTLLPAGVSMQDAALVGCAVATGCGAVTNVAAPRPGQSMAVFGTGGVGLFAVAQAAISGCYPLIAIDVVAEKLELAQKLGATHAINPKDGDVLAAIQKIVKGGVDLAVEASGRPQVMEQALSCVRQQGGAAVVIGNARADEKLSIDPKQLNMGKQLRGCWGGDSVPERDYPRYCNLIASGKLKPSLLLTKSYKLNQINAALDDLEAGRCVRPLIELS